MCDPDYNAWTEEQNPRPEGTTTNLRSAGFHIHVGYDNCNVSTSLMIVKYLDMFLGVPSVLFDPDTERRKLYGKAGAFRLQPWGVEYRVLSSYMMSSPILLNYVYDQVICAVSWAMEGMSGLPEDACYTIPKIINNSDVEAAKAFCKKYYINITI